MNLIAYLFVAHVLTAICITVVERCREFMWSLPENSHVVKLNEGAKVLSPSYPDLIYGFEIGFYDSVAEWCLTNPSSLAGHYSSRVFLYWVLCLPAGTESEIYWSVAWSLTVIFLLLNGWLYLAARSHSYRRIFRPYSLLFLGPPFFLRWTSHAQRGLWECNLFPNTFSYMHLIAVHSRLDQGYSRLPGSPGGWFCQRILSLSKTSGKRQKIFCPSRDQWTRYAPG